MCACSRAGAALTGLAVVWTVSSSLSVYPHCVAYFNEAAGGFGNGRQHLVHTSIDVEQDLFYLQEWMETHPSLEPVIYVAKSYWDPESLGVHCQSTLLTHTAEESEGTTVSSDVLLRSVSGVVAVRAGLLMGQNRHVYLGSGKHLNCNEQTFALLRRTKPIARVGGSLRLYRVPIGSG